MLLDQNGLDMTGFDAFLGEVLGRETGKEGVNVLTQTIFAARPRVEVRDFLYCLAQSPGTIARKHLVDRPGQRVDEVLRNLEDALAAWDAKPGAAPLRLTAETAAPEVPGMLETAERLAREAGLPAVTDPVFTRAILEVAGQELQGCLELLMGETGLGLFRRELIVTPVGDREISVLGADGRIDQRLFDASGRRFLSRLTEDAASLGARKVSVRHVLYTLLAQDSSPLYLALAMTGADVKRDFHAALARELARPGAKRVDGLELHREVLLEIVIQLFTEAVKACRQVGRSQVHELDVCVAMAGKQGRELSRLAPPGRAFDLSAVQDYLATTEPSEEDEAPVMRYSIADIEAQVKQRIRGQDAAVNRVLPWIKRLRFGLPRDGRPAAVLLFLGPTGAGKTQLAKELARFVFGSDEQLLFLEMGQFKSKESMNMFIGAPPGYVGYGDGKLTNGLAEKPECVVLFDEIEKADTQVFDTVLRFADEGVISDPAGPVRDGRRCIIVMTTNAGQQWLRDHLGAHPTARENPETLARDLFDAAMTELREKGFRPEFLGRVDERITFLPFTLETCEQIVGDVLSREREKLQRLKGLTLDVDPEVLAMLAEAAFGRSLDEGARGAPRAVNEQIITPLIDLLADRAEADLDGGPTHVVASKHGLTQVVLEVIR
ncbi:MAG: AAA family ATPase [Armatimonadetes bacterium]|nr:AAA family ATPase [Armatimonadota bacterium]